MVKRRDFGFIVTAMAVTIWLTWPAVAWADTCKERADAIAARRVPASQRDPDCKRGGVMLATLATTAAAAAASVAAVSVGLGLGLGVFGAAGAPSIAAAGASPPPGDIPPAALDTAVESQPEPPPLIASSPLATEPSTPLAETTAWTGMALTSILRGPSAFTALERAGLVERVPGGEGHRLRAGVEAGDLKAGSSSGVGGMAFFARADGTLDPNIAVAMIDPGPTAQAAPMELPLSSLPGGLPPEIRQALIELLNPAKLMGIKFDDIEKYREEYADAKAIKNPVEAEQTQDYVVYTFSNAFGLSQPAARALLELPQAKWNAVATMIAALG